MPMMIAFDKASYTSGSLVSGHVVILRTKSPQKVKGLSLRILGRANRLLNDPDNHNPIKSHKKEVYFDDKIDIFGHDGRDSILNVGETLFPFTFTLPPGLPSSFIWNRGNILYFVEAHLTRSGWKDDKTAAVRLAVDGIYDLNLDPLAPLPGGGNASKYVNHLLTKSGPFAFSIATKKSGFLRGHSLPFQINVRNLSKIDAKRVKVSLVQEIGQDGKMWSSVIEEVRGPAVPAGEIQAWDGHFKVPGDVPPTNLGNLLSFSPVLSLNYFIQVELSPKSPTGLQDSLTTKVPVIIGTIPLPRSRDRLRLLQLQNHTHNLHEENCPLHSHSHGHGHTTPNSPSPTPVHQQCQFSPGLLIHNQNHQAIPGHSPFNCRHCPVPVPPNHHIRSHSRSHSQSHSQGIYRRLRNLQRRRRESPPPSYDEAVTGEEPDQNIHQDSPSNANNANNSLPQKTQQSPAHHSSVSSHEHEEQQEQVLEPSTPPLTPIGDQENVVNCSNSNQNHAKVSSDGIVTPTQISISNSNTSQRSQYRPNTPISFTTNHVVTVQIKCSGSDEDPVIYEDHI